ncbi:hypothetical protein [Penaeicola halotolerans]|uniref:hypothetical protein n=1 Tax=Penaeicola halotolerans TaxID=2793196 RepID=UPI001CF83843|nr:hypothetical protein [Penaeicola halotolerans]
MKKTLFTLILISFTFLGYGQEVRNDTLTIKKVKSNELDPLDFSRINASQRINQDKMISVADNNYALYDTILVSLSQKASSAIQTRADIIYATRFKGNPMSIQAFEPLIPALMSRLEQLEIPQNGATIDFSFYQDKDGKLINPVIVITPQINTSKTYYLDQADNEAKKFEKYIINFRFINTQVISVMVNDLSDLNEISQQGPTAYVNAYLASAEIQKKYKSKNKKVYEQILINSDKQEISDIQSINYNPARNRNFFVGTYGFSTSLIRNTLTPNLEFAVGYNWKGKYGETIRYLGVQTTYHYFFERAADRSFEVYDNAFVGIFFKSYSPYSKQDKVDIGIGISYLTRSSGDYFEGNTFKFSIDLTKRNSNVSLIPEIIFEDNFSKSYPSIKLGVFF